VRLDCLLPPAIKAIFELGRVPALVRLTRIHVKYIDASAILGDGALDVFLINRSLNEMAEIEIDPGSGKFESILSAEIVSGSSPQDGNTYEEPYRVISRPFSSGKVAEGKACVLLPPLSFVTLNLRMQ